MSAGPHRKKDAKIASAAKNSSKPIRLDAGNVAGITALMNPSTLTPGINPVEMENLVIGRANAPIGVHQLDPAASFSAEIDKLAAELDAADQFGGLRIADPSPGSALSAESDETKSGPAPAGFSDPGPASFADSAPAGFAGPNTVEPIDMSFSRPDAAAAEEESDEESSSDEEDAEADPADPAEPPAEAKGGSAEPAEMDDADRVIMALQKSLGLPAATAPKSAATTIAAELPISEQKRASRVTAEQERHQHIKTVMSSLREGGQTPYNMERERVLDQKENKLEQIDQLRATLIEEGINCDSVGRPTLDSDITVINSTLRALQLKNARNRYSSIAEEVILTAAETLEIFDGTKAIPYLGWKPDYRGYSATVNTKLHRMRFETSQVVGAAIEKYNIGPTLRIVMELLPSLILYPRHQRRLHDSASAGSYSPRMQDSLLAIRSGEEQQRVLENIREV